MTVEELRGEFTPRRVTRRSGGLLLLWAADALALVRRAAEERFPVLGVGGYWVQPTGIRPAVEYSADFSAAARAGLGNWDAAAAFLTRGAAAADLAFEVLLWGDRVAAV